MRLLKVVSWIAVMALVSVPVLGLGPAQMQVSGDPPDPPTVNGRFYGDGDDARYDFMMESTGGRAEVYYKLIDEMLYLAMVVSPDVNDNVFGETGKEGDQDYLQSAGWQGVGNKHQAETLIGSDHMQISLLCSGGQNWTWEQDYAYDADGDKDPDEADWLSDPSGTDGGGTPPPGLESASSLAWNMNNTTWDVTLDGARTSTKTWKSPDDPVVGDVTDDGWPTYDSTHDWEWAMVYEMSINTTAAGCTGDISVYPIYSHNSPAKDGDEDTPFPPVIDYGDAPDPYPTAGATNASHKLVINGPYLGDTVDAEADGQPDDFALGDDLHGDDDEDGVVFTTPLVPGQEAGVNVTASGASGNLSAWIDFNDDGDWDDVGEQIFTDEFLTEGTHALTFNVTDDATSTNGTFARFRFSTAAGLSYSDATTAAPDGEVEDYMVDIEQEVADIDIEKWTNGVDADDPTGPFIPEGKAVNWTYIVTNTGTVPLSSVNVTDDNGTSGNTTDDFSPTYVEGDTDGDGELDADETWTYNATGTAALGQYENSANVTAFDSENEEEVADDDPSHYYGSSGAIHIEKATNGEDADSPTGPYIGVGDLVTWTYNVTNTGNVSLLSVNVTDDNGTPDDSTDDFSPTCIDGDTDDDGELDTDEAWIYNATGTAALGQYENWANVTAERSDDGTVVDNDPSHYFGVEPDIDIEKATNGEDADDPTGPIVAIGSEVTWLYEVTNPGNVPLSGINVTDDNGTSGNTTDDFSPTYIWGDTDLDDELDTGETWIYSATDFALPGQYANSATVSGNPPEGDPVTDQDPSHYLGGPPDIQIIKTVSEGHTGCACPGGELVVGVSGYPVTYCFEVINTGDSYLSPISIVDPDLGIRRTDMTKCTEASDSEPLAPGDRLTFYYETTLKGNLVNTAEVTGTPTDQNGEPTGHIDVTDQDDAAVRVERYVVGGEAHPVSKVGLVAPWAALAAVIAAGGAFLLRRRSSDVK